MESKSWLIVGFIIIIIDYMSDTYKDKGRADFKNGKKSKNASKYLNHCKRHNSEKSYFNPRLNSLKNKIMDSDMENQVNYVN